MIGVNEENLDKLIKINNMNQIEVDNHIKKILISINEINDCYSGKDLNLIFNNLIIEKSDVSKISKVIKAYSDVLYDVKVSYNNQDSNVSGKIKQINSNL